MLYEFNKSDVSTYQLEGEISANASIITGWQSVIVRGEILEISMKAALSNDEYAALLATVTAHTPTKAPTRAVLASIVENEDFDTLGLELTYRMKPWLFDIPATSGQHYFTISFPYPIMLLGGTVDIHAAMVGDSMRYCILAPTNVCQLPIAVAANDTTITLPSQAGTYCFKGLDVLLNTVHVGRIISIARGAETDVLTLDQAITQDFAIGSVFAIGYTAVEKYYISTAPMVLWASRDTERGALIPAGQTMAFNYWNDTGTAKKVQLTLEYYS